MDARQDRRSTRRRRGVIAVVALATAVLVPAAVPTGGAGAATDQVVVAAGDIACDPTDPAFNGGQGTATKCKMQATANLIDGVNPNAVYPLGDEQYESGTLAQFNASYDLSWGDFKSITQPVVGDEEYETPGASGYFAYFGPAAHGPNGWYSFDQGDWHVVVLNSNCSQVGCGASSTQVGWLNTDLATSQRQCTLALFHHPRFVSSNNGGNTRVAPFWNSLYQNKADVVLNGNAHLYERFALQNPAGAADPNRGIREFVVGTGGKSKQSPATPKPNSQVRHKAFGILKLTLHPASYSWQFLPIGGGPALDSGSASCV
jgi:acid phosphatase type 7